jgi:GMP synthase (glutamine-hydrolysing)
MALKEGNSQRSMIPKSVQRFSDKIMLPRKRAQMPSPRLLVCEGNTAELRAQQVTAGVTIMSDGYADLLRRLLPGAVVDICFPADPGANLPIGGLASYDGVAITGSALNVYDRGPTIDPQIELAREVLRARTPLFGSCWGLQVITVATGGVVRANPKGRELGIGRKIALTPQGRDHPMFAGKAAVFDAVTVHLDEIETLAPGTTVLAANAYSDVQAAEIKVDGATAWAVQYHPEFSLADMAAIVRRYGPRLIREGFFADETARDGYVADLETLDREPDNKPLAWRYGMDAAVLDPGVRTMEIANWITHQVLPTRAERGRA